jgi:hypothetical protein
MTPTERRYRKWSPIEAGRTLQRPFLQLPGSLPKMGWFCLRVRGEGMAGKIVHLFYPRSGSTLT